MTKKNQLLYSNPVVRQDFPDPFVLKFCGEYYAICTGFWHDGGAFGILRSRDLVNWSDCGSALNPLPFAAAPCYWAPELFYDNGKFYLYYSVGNEELMEIRVAVSEVPHEKYVDAGYKLTNQQFAIDAHVFVDADNERWLFYATDFLDHSHIGTGTVRDRLLSPFELEGNPQPVTRAKYNWQVYDPNRASKGGVRWHTIEGSFVLKRKDLYYQMFSGGNWQNISYGVSYATTNDIKITDGWSQIADGEVTLPILRTIPEKVIGPGHNSVVRGTNNQQLYCVYHRWAADLSGRQMAIDPLDFAGERMLVIGPSYEPVPLPNAPTVEDFFENQQSFEENWQSDDQAAWTIKNNCAISNGELEQAEAVCDFKSDSFLVEVSAKALAFEDRSGYGFCLKNKSETALRCLILPETKQIKLSEQDEYGQAIYSLPPNFEPQAFHLWRVEVDNFYVKICLDEANFILEKQLKFAPKQFALTTQKCVAAFAGFALTAGFEDLFDWTESCSTNDFAVRGWSTQNSITDAWIIEDNLLKSNSTNGEALIFKNEAFTDFELTVNVRFDDHTNGYYGFILQESAASKILITLESDNAKHFLNVSQAGNVKSFALPDSFLVDKFQQFRFRVQDGILQVQHETVVLGELEIERVKRQIGILVKNAAAAFDMVRVTVIS